MLSTFFIGIVDAYSTIPVICGIFAWIVKRRRRPDGYLGWYHRGAKCDWTLFGRRGRRNGQLANTIDQTKRNSSHIISDHTLLGGSTNALGLNVGMLVSHIPSTKSCPPPILLSQLVSLKQVSPLLNPSHSSDLPDLQF